MYSFLVVLILFKAVQYDIHGFFRNDKNTVLQVNMGILDIVN